VNVTEIFFSWQLSGSSSGTKCWNWSRGPRIQRDFSIIVEANFFRKKKSAEEYKKYDMHFLSVF
jgi:hypothetical protein